MSSLIKTDNPDYMKDEDNGALVSTNVRAFNEHKRKEEQARKLKTQENDLNNIKSEVCNLKDDISEMKDLLHQLLNK